MTSAQSLASLSAMEASALKGLLSAQTVVASSTTQDELVDAASSLQKIDVATLKSQPAVRANLLNRVNSLAAPFSSNPATVPDAVRSLLFDLSNQLAVPALEQMMQLLPSLPGAVQANLMEECLSLTELATHAWICQARLSVSLASTLTNSCKFFLNFVSWQNLFIPLITLPLRHCHQTHQHAQSLKESEIASSPCAAASAFTYSDPMLLVR